MKADNIITLPNQNLRKKAEKIHVITDEVKQTIQEMIDASLDWEKHHPHEISAALAAPQIDKLLRIIIVRADLDDKSNQEFVALINPEIVKFEGKIVEDFEGCLSIKGIYGKVPRHNKIRVRALDINGDEVRIKAQDFLARVIQHEIDHINGVLFVDHIRDKKHAFYHLDDKGELRPLNYEKEVKNNKDLWEDLDEE